MYRPVLWTFVWFYLNAPAFAEESGQEQQTGLGKVKIEFDLIEGDAVVTYGDGAKSRAKVSYAPNKKMVAYKDESRKQCLLEKIKRNKPMKSEDFSRIFHIFSKPLIPKKAEHLAGKRLTEFCRDHMMILLNDQHVHIPDYSENSQDSSIETQEKENDDARLTDPNEPTLTRSRRALPDRANRGLTANKKPATGLRSLRNNPVTHTAHVPIDITSRVTITTGHVNSQWSSPSARSSQRNIPRVTPKPLDQPKPASFPSASPEQKTNIPPSSGPKIDNPPPSSAAKPARFPISAPQRLPPSSSAKDLPQRRIQFPKPSAPSSSGGQGPVYYPPSSKFQEMPPSTSGRTPDPVPPSSTSKSQQPNIARYYPPSSFSKLQPRFPPKNVENFPPSSTSKVQPGANQFPPSTVARSQPQQQPGPPFPPTTRGQSPQGRGQSPRPQPTPGRPGMNNVPTARSRNLPPVPTPRSRSRPQAPTPPSQPTPPSSPGGNAPRISPPGIRPPNGTPIPVPIIAGAIIPIPIIVNTHHGGSEHSSPSSEGHRSQTVKTVETYAPSSYAKKHILLPVAHYPVSSAPKLEVHNAVLPKTQTVVQTVPVQHRTVHQSVHDNTHYTTRTFSPSSSGNAPVYYIPSSSAGHFPQTPTTHHYVHHPAPRAQVQPNENHYVHYPASRPQVHDIPKPTENHYHSPGNGTAIYPGNLYASSTVHAVYAPQYTLPLIPSYQHQPAHSESHHPPQNQIPAHHGNEPPHPDKSYGTYPHQAEPSSYHPSSPGNYPPSGAHSYPSATQTSPFDQLPQPPVDHSTQFQPQYPPSSTSQHHYTPAYYPPSSTSKHQPQPQYVPSSTDHGSPESHSNGTDEHHSISQYPPSSFSKFYPSYNNRSSGGGEHDFRNGEQFNNNVQQGGANGGHYIPPSSNSLSPRPCTQVSITTRAIFTPNGIVSDSPCGVGYRAVPQCVTQNGQTKVPCNGNGALTTGNGHAEVLHPMQPHHQFARLQVEKNNSSGNDSDVNRDREELELVDEEKESENGKTETKTSEEEVKEGDVLEPGDRILGKDGYTISEGLRGRVVSVSGQVGKTRAEDKDAKSHFGQFRYNSDLGRYAKDTNGKSYSNCDGDPTFTCTEFLGSNGRAKICKPNPRRKPDGSPC